MFDTLRKRRIADYTEKAAIYVKRKYVLAAPQEKPAIVTPPKTGSDSGVRHSRKTIKGDNRPTIKYSIDDTSDDLSDIRFSIDEPSETESITLNDPYSTTAVSAAMKNYQTTAGAETLLKDLEKSTNQTFVDALIAYIKKKGLRDSEVYKAAQIDRRLFSKIMSDRQYKPSKDTAIALALALRLTLGEATDMLSRAGYVLSHSNKKDIIVEYFFRERIYKLDDINEVLYNLGQKIIGR